MSSTQKRWLIAIVSAGLLALFFLSHPAVAGSGTSSSVAADDASTLDDQVDLSLTVYNSDLALVRDIRQVRLPVGTFDLRFMDIAATVNPATVHFRSLTEPAKVGVLEQNYEYDLLEPEKLLKKYVGREVTLVRTRQENGTTRQEEVKATLLAMNNGPVWKIGDEIVTGMYTDHLRFPTLPENLYSRPTLIWTLGNTGSPDHRIEASYLAGNLSWSADYVLTVERDEQTAGLDGWVTLTNNSGTAFKKANLQLVAGELNRVRDENKLRRAYDQMNALKAVAESSAFAQEAFSEYHLYTLGRRTSIFNNETKQLSLLAGSNIPVQKRFVVEGQSLYYHNRQHPGEPQKDPVQVYYKLRNDERSGLGAPLPAGTVRVYQADSKGGTQFAGEDRIDHTPKDEWLNLHIGNAFDIVSEHKQTEYEKISDEVYDLAFEVTVRNHKPTPVTVEVNEPIGGTWQMLEASHRWTKTSAWAARFELPVDANGTAVLKYRVRVRW